MIIHDRDETDLVQMEIDTGDAQPRKLSARIPFAVKRDCMTTQGNARAWGHNTIKEPMGKPCSPCQEKDSTLCFCVEYQDLNAVTIADKFPLPR